ncbi:hypothetical protein [Sporomusa sphaeroides]|uniref:Type II secretion system protein G n=1 Tax=Sporomusa sphaeroides DSM 2875 TaxID=1337886 RepID=A0A1U7M9W1_9FIRM|nr:hypothetical protein [Sporomusa sphaeroides]OLS54288.1 hypothetical protein SPSPH_45340 [Sporomusa sphaeroides DSM 2875]CVK21668.1 hypothetical protein SSPH_04363 [Sporomusa sphaeroides DSM 2875]
MIKKLRNQKSFGGIFSTETIIYVMVIILVFGAGIYTGPKVIDLVKRGLTHYQTYQLASACAQYAVESKSGEPPATLGDLTVGLTAEQSIDGEARDPYVKVPGWTTDPTTITDYWDAPYQYTRTGADRNVTSTGNGKTPIVRPF